MHDVGLWPQYLYVEVFLYPQCVDEVGCLYVKIIFSYHVITEYGQNMFVRPWTLTHKSIGIFLSFSFICVWTTPVYEVSNLYVENCLSFRITKKVWQNMSVWPWPLDPKIYRCLPFLIFHLYKKYQVCKLRTFWVITLQQMWMDRHTKSIFDGGALIKFQKVLLVIVP